MASLVPQPNPKPSAWVSVAGWLPLVLSPEIFLHNASPSQLKSWDRPETTPQICSVCINQLADKFLYVNCCGAQVEAGQKDRYKQINIIIIIIIIIHCFKNA